MTIPSGADQAHKTRKRRLHGRQATIFGLLLTALVFVTAVGVLILTGAVAAPFDRGFARPADDSAFSDIKPPCVPPETAPATKNTISVRVLNASDRKGLAKAVAKELGKRGYGNPGSGNIPAPDKETGYTPFPDEVHATQIRFGPAGLAQAYTVAANFESPLLLLDAREDASVDVIVGSEFSDVIPTDEVQDSHAEPLKSPKNCVAVEEIKPLPILPEQTDEASEETPEEG